MQKSAEKICTLLYSSLKLYKNGAYHHFRQDFVTKSTLRNLYRPHYHRMARRKAFTLIELLVVIAIIAILAAILFPVLAQARIAGKKAVSLSNMRQVGLAMRMYMDDNNQMTPTLYYYDANNLSVPSTQGFYYWPLLVLNYTKNEDIFLCPMDREDDVVLHDSNGRGRFDPNNTLHYYIMGANPSYGYNYRYLAQKITGNDPNGTNPTPFYYIGMSESAISTTSSTICVAEATMKDKARPGGGTITSSIGYSRIEPPSFWTGVSPSATAQGQLWPRFNKDLVNVVWLDSHVKATPLGFLASPGDIVWNGQN